MKDFKLVKQGGAWYTYEDVDVNTGEVLEEIKFQSKDFAEKIINKPDIHDRLYNRICEAYIFKYVAGIDGGIDDVVVDEELRLVQKRSHTKH